MHELHKESQLKLPLTGIEYLSGTKYCKINSSQMLAALSIKIKKHNFLKFEKANIILQQFKEDTSLQFRNGINVALQLIFHTT
jgi:hypothetical protein